MTVSSRSGRVGRGEKLTGVKTCVTLTRAESLWLDDWKNVSWSDDLFFLLHHALVTCDLFDLRQVVYQKKFDFI